LFFIFPYLTLVVPFDSALQFFVGGNWKCVSARSASSAFARLGVSVLLMLEMMSQPLIFWFCCIAFAGLEIPTELGWDFVPIHTS
jgi:hypothetical protein